MSEVDVEGAEAPPVRWGMGDAVAGNAASLVLSVIAVGIALGIAGGAGETTDDLPLWSTAVLQVPLWLGLFGTVWLACRRKGSGSLRRDFGLEMRVRDVPIGLVAGFVGQIGIALIVLPLYDLLGVDTDKVGETAERLADRAVTGPDIVLLLGIVVIGAPIVEELFYRGLWLRSIERRVGSAPAALALSSLLFGVIHLQPYDIPALTLAGALFGALAVRYGRLGPAIWAHLAFNLTAVVNLLVSSP